MGRGPIVTLQYLFFNRKVQNLSKRKILVGVVTSKDKKRTLKLIKKFKLNIRYIVPPSKNLRGKPFPDQLIKAMDLAKISYFNTIYIGDMFSTHTCYLINSFH